MQRRTLFKNLLFAGIGASLPLQSLLARKDRDHRLTGIYPVPGMTPRPFHRFKLGDLDLTVVTDGHIVMSPVQPNFAPDAPKATVDSLLKSSFRPTDGVDLGVNVLVVRKDQHTILVDTGAAGLGPTCGWLNESLTDAGIPPESVTDIVISHAHLDHIGGLFGKDGARQFPKAQVYLSAIEYGFWTSEHPDLSKCRYPKDLLLPMAAIIKKNLLTLKPSLKLFDPATELFGCIRLQAAPGHTPGHTLTHVYSGKEDLVHVADLLHSDVLLIPHPEWGFAGDNDFSQAAATRQQVLTVLADNKTPVFSYHLPWPGIGHIGRKDGAFEWVAETYTFPA